MFLTKTYVGCLWRPSENEKRHLWTVAKFAVFARARGMHANFATLILFFDGFEVFRIVALSNDLMGFGSRCFVYTGRLHSCLLYFSIITALEWNL